MFCCLDVGRINFELILNLFSLLWKTIEFFDLFYWTFGPRIIPIYSCGQRARTILTPEHRFSQLLHHYRWPNFVQIVKLIWLLCKIEILGIWNTGIILTHLSLQYIVGRLTVILHETSCWHTTKSILKLILLLLTLP